MKTRRHISKEEALGKMQAIASKSEKCESDILTRLNKTNLGDEDKNWIIASLKEDKFIDDERFTYFYVKDKLNISKWGRKKIAYALKFKNIDQNIIESALNSIDRDEYLNSLRKLLKVKNKSLKADNIYSKKGKLFRFAAQKGYEASLINDIINEIFDKK